ncbi:MAG: Mrp/NBP35 family ATP-binding protein [Planctomycetota bacterium]
MADLSAPIKEALSSVLPIEQVVGLKETNGKVLVTIAAAIPTPEKPAFADRVKTAVRGVEGVKDVFISFAEPTPAQQPPQQQAPNPLEKVDRILAVGAGKGGVGKSTVSVNLAIALAQQGKRVGLLDADIYGPSAAVMTGCSDYQAEGDKHQRVIPAMRHGIKVISIAFLLPEDQSAVVWRGPMVGKMVQQLLTNVAWGELDYLIVDLPPGTGDAVLSLAQTVPLSGAVVVTTPQDVALLDVLKAMEMFEQVKVPVAGVVENMAGFTCPACGVTTDIFLKGAGRKAAERFKVPLLGTLPLDPAVPPGGDEGQPVSIAAPDSATAQGFHSIAKETISRLDAMAGPPQGFNLSWS